MRLACELTYQNKLEMQLPYNLYFGDMVMQKLLYYPTVTREKYEYNSLGTDDGLKTHQGRITELLTSNRLTEDLDLPKIDPLADRFMICGNDAMLQELMQILDAKGFHKATSRTQGHYVIEQAFIEK